MAQQAIFWDYSNKTLQGNWYEDRIQVPSDVTFGSQQFLTIKQRPDITRCIPVHYDPEQGEVQEYSTTAASFHAGEAHEKERKAYKGMVSANNFHEIHTVRTTAAPEKGFGATIPAHPATEFAVYKETTYKTFHEDQPAAYKLKQPPPEQGDDERFRGGYPASCNRPSPTSPCLAPQPPSGKRDLTST